MNDDMSSFSIGRSIQFGWTNTIQYFGFLFLYQLVTSLIIGCFNFFGLPECMIRLLTMRIYLRVVDGGKATFMGEDLDQSFPQFLPLFGARILLFLLVLAGFILLIIPGIYWALKYQFVPYILVDQKCGIMDAFTLSSQLTKGKKWKLLGFNLTLFGIILLGILCFFMGLLIAVPLIGLAEAYIYRELANS